MYYRKIVFVVLCKHPKRKLHLICSWNIQGTFLPFVWYFHRHSRSRLLTHRIGGVTCMINPRWRGNRAKNYKTLQGNQCFSRFKTSRCLESLRINIFWKQLIIAEVLSTICVISAEFLVKISLVKCVMNWSLGQFETFVVQNMYFWPALASWVLLWPTTTLN